MDYLELKVKCSDPVGRDLLVYYLGEEGFESFGESEADEMLAYIRPENYDQQRTDKILEKFNASATITRIPGKNWNEEWEKNFPPVTIDGRCNIRAPFHSPLPGIEFEIVIMPKMSFGTAHHETTSQMISLMLNTGFRNKKVLDMGCGTGILAILAEKLGAHEILAVDYDNWAYQNAKENVVRNNCTRITVKEGEVAEAEGKYDIIIANINRNILLQQIKSYSLFSLPGAILMMSGFYEEDLPAITACANENGFNFKNSVIKNRWVAATYTR